MAGVRLAPLPPDALRGKSICFCGRFATMSQAQWADMVKGLGAAVMDSPARETDFLVLGQDGWRATARGAPPRPLRIARNLVADGAPIRICSEEEFLDELGFDDRATSVHQHYTLAQISRILGIPGRRLRDWLRRGLLEPAETMHRLAWFTFTQVAAARAMAEMVEAGRSPREIRAALDQMGRWLPHTTELQQRLAVWEGRLVVRDGDRLVEPNGQLRFEFADPEQEVGEMELSVVTAQGATDALFEEALECEDQGHFEQAIELYAEAIDLDPEDPTLHFNLGNAQFELGQYAAALSAYEQASQLDPQYVESWNNLGNTLAELGRPEEAIAAYRRALDLLPGYADAHYNLAETLAARGDLAGAERHWRHYLRHEPVGSLADKVWSRLGETPWTADPEGPPPTDEQPRLISLADFASDAAGDPPRGA